MTSATRIHSRIYKLLHSRHRLESVSWSVLPPPPPWSSTPLVRWNPLLKLNFLGFIIPCPVHGYGHVHCKHPTCRLQDQFFSQQQRRSIERRRLHHFRLLEKNEDYLGNELQLLNIHGFEHCLLNDWNVNNLVHYTTDESESESQSRNCSLSELDCRKLLLHVQRVSRMSSKRHGLRELVSAWS